MTVVETCDHLIACTHLMGAGYFFARPRRKAGFSMGDGNDGAAAQAQVAGEPQAQGDQAAQAAVTAGLQGEIAEAAKTAEGAEKLRAEMDELRRKGDEERVGFELQLAGVRNVKAARALLPDHDNDIEKLKAAEPWLFSAGAAPAPTGATGLPNAGAATDEGATLKRWRRIAGLDDGDKE